MKKNIKIFLILALTCFSFYYTDQIITYTKKQNPIYLQILNKRKEKNIEPVNAEISQNQIISGKKGKKIDVEESYNKMKQLGEYNENLLVYEENEPTITIKENYDKYIIGANKENREVSIIIKIEKKDNLNEIINILNKNNIKATFFINKKTISEIENELKKIIENNHYIGNGENKKIKQTNKLLEHYTNYKIKYCLTEEEDNELLKKCEKENMHTLKIEQNNNSLYNYIKNNLSKGKIYLVRDKQSEIKELDLSIKYIKQKGYKIIDINELLNA